MANMRMVLACGICDEEITQPFNIHAEEQHNQDLQIVIHGYCGFCSRKMELLLTKEDDSQFWACWYCHRTITLKPE